jgi:hypothetical protein
MNKYHHEIQNGNNIYGHHSTTQGCLLLPFPNDSNKFYLFSHMLDAANSEYEIYYSVIDKTLNSDSGAVVLKNLSLPGIVNVSEHLQAVKHGNGKDWWLIIHKYLSNQFYIYLIDSGGIQIPFIQSIGNYFNVGSFFGQMKFSPNGDKITIVSSGGHIDLFDFDRCTGILNNWISLGFNTN